MKKKSLFLILLLSKAAIGGALLNDSQLLSRCYSQITGSSLPLTHPLLKKITNSEIKGSQACSQLLESVSLSEQGEVMTSTPEKFKIFRTFQKLHSSWFTRFELNRNTQDHPNSDIYDTNEMGYHFGWSLFRDGEHVSNTLTREYSFVGKRNSSKPAKYLLDKDIEGRRGPRKTDRFHKWEYGSNQEEGGLYLGPISFWKPTFVQTGELSAIKPFKAGKNKIKKWITDSKSFPVYVNRPLGGGILGTIPYLILNSGHLNQTSNGGDRLNRRFTTSVLKDLLCRNTPLLEKEDVLPFLDPKSKHKFRKSYQCQTCHVTTDLMAAALRNIEVYNSGDVTLNYSIKNVFVHSKGHKRISDFPNDNPNYYKSPPEGRIYFRDLYRNLVNSRVTSIQEIGQSLSKTEDFYLCISSRYLSYFSGQDIEVENINYFDKKTNHPLENLTIKLANHLKEHGDLKKLIKEIFQSKLYAQKTLGGQLE
jgi:hypothetical protein